MSPLTPESSDVGTPRNRLKEHLDSALAVRSSTWTTSPRWWPSWRRDNGR